MNLLVPAWLGCELWSDRARTLVEKTDKNRAILLQDARLKQDRWEAEGKVRSRLLLLVSQGQFADGVRPAKPQEGGQTGSQDDSAAQDALPIDEVIRWDLQS